MLGQLVLMFPDSLRSDVLSAQAQKLRAIAERIDRDILRSSDRSVRVVSERFDVRVFRRTVGNAVSEIVEADASRIYLGLFYPASVSTGIVIYPGPDFDATTGISLPSPGMEWLYARHFVLLSRSWYAVTSGPPVPIVIIEVRESGRK